EELARRLDLVAREGEVDAPLGDGCDPLRWDVLRPAESARRNGEAVEDVLVVVARDLVDLADLRAIGSVDLPAGPDQQPRNGVAHARDLAKTRPDRTSTLSACSARLWRTSSHS